MFLLKHGLTVSYYFWWCRIRRWLVCDSFRDLDTAFELVVDTQQNKI